jgi:hypothetical protein
MSMSVWGTSTIRTLLCTAVSTLSEKSTLFSCGARRRIPNSSAHNPNAVCLTVRDIENTIGIDEHAVRAR